MDYTRFRVAVAVPVSRKTLAKIARWHKETSSPHSPSSWKEWMPDVVEMNPSDDVRKPNWLAVSCLLEVHEDYRGGCHWVAQTCTGEAPEEGPQCQDPMEAMLDGIKRLLSVDDYWDLPEVHGLYGKEEKEN